jgi:hypothetical protein
MSSPEDNHKPEDPKQVFLDHVQEGIIQAHHLKDRLRTIGDQVMLMKYDELKHIQTVDLLMDFDGVMQDVVRSLSNLTEKVRVWREREASHVQTS